MIFQDPSASLDPRMTIGSAIAEPLNINAKLSKAEKRERVQELLRVVGLNSYFANRLIEKLDAVARVMAPPVW